MMQGKLSYKKQSHIINKLDKIFTARLLPTRLTAVPVMNREEIERLPRTLIYR
jgi:hypothetical protein